MITSAVGTFICKFTLIRILLATFPSYFSLSTIILMMVVLLIFVASPWIGYILFSPFHCIAYFYFFQYSGLVECHYVCVCFNCFPLFFYRYSLPFHYSLFFLSLFLSPQLYIVTVPYFLQPLYISSEICEDKFWQLFYGILSFSVKNQNNSFFSPPLAGFGFEVFLPW